jgi:hypothetical protein
MKILVFAYNAALPLQQHDNWSHPAIIRRVKGQESRFLIADS